MSNSAIGWIQVAVAVVSVVVVTALAFGSIRSDVAVHEKQLGPDGRGYTLRERVQKLETRYETIEKSLERIEQALGTKPIKP